MNRNYSIHSVLNSLTLIVAFVFIFEAPGLFSPPQACADDWKMEFDAICSKTDDAVTFSVDEIAALISRCDKLKTAMDSLDESTKKVYLRRLQMCRDLFLYVLESKKTN